MKYSRISLDFAKADGLRVTKFGMHCPCTIHWLMSSVDIGLLDAVSELSVMV